MSSFDYLKTAIKQQGCTLQQVADASGMTKGYLSQLLNAKIKSPSAQKLEALHRFLGLEFPRQKKTIGGERGRLHLAKLLQVGGNMLLLDEPTNDLDIETLRALENALLEFPGCAMVISHDRWFLDRIATHILDYQDEGKVEFFEGNFTEYEEYKKRTLGADALEPKRIKYKRIAK
jgi:ATPase subunit of ABC transporter with duplicated ATPase domains